MTIEAAYLRFLQLANGNMTNNNIGVNKPRFVMLFNSAQIKFVEYVLDKRNDDTVRYISELLVPDKSLGKVGNSVTHSSFRLPDDYFDLASAFAEASYGNCSDKIKLYEVKMEDLEEKYNDWSNEPSFRFRESFYTTSSGNLLVYRKDFEIDKAYLTYYRYPKKVDISGYTHVDKTPSTMVDPELSDRAVERILKMVAKEVSANSGNPGQYQLDKDMLSPTL